MAIDSHSDVPTGAKLPGVCLLSETFPPAIGGSGELLYNVYSRFPSTVPVTVLAHGRPGMTESGTLRVIREPMQSTEWGLLRPSGLLFHARRTARVLSQCRKGPAIVHCSRGLPEGVGARIARVFGGPRYICWAHGEEIPSASTSRELRAILHNALCGASAIIANSLNTAGTLTAFGVPADKVHVVHPGVDVDRFRPDVPGARELRAELGAPDELIILAVGRLQRRKGHDLVLRALASGALDDIHPRYVIVGDGDDRDRLRQMAKDLNVGARVTFAGAIPADRLPVYYAASDMFVHPNRIEDGDFEGFGLVFLEAAAAGLPAIGGNTGGVPEAIQKDVTGLLVSGTDPGELAAAIRSLATKARRKEMGTAGRARAERECSWTAAAARVLSVHAEVAGRRAESV